MCPFESAPSRFDRGSRRRLTRHTAARFTGDTLFDCVARVVCRAECLPRKELFEAWEVAKRVRRHLRGGVIVEACAGHGLLAHLMLLLDDTSLEAHCVDVRRTQSAERIERAMVAEWPWLAGRVRYHERELEGFAVPADAIVISVHACGELTDRVLDMALAARSRIAVMPCCQALATCDDGSLSGWLPGPLAVDVTRVARLRAAGYRVRTKTIPEDITVQNRLLLGEPPPDRR